MTEIYLDNSATTKISEEALNAILIAYESFGNPSSLHSIGVRASKQVKNAANSVLSLLEGDRHTGSVFFTSGGTEANNLALIGGYTSKKRRPGDTVLITDSEHASVEEAALHIEKCGARIIRIPTKEGKLDVGFLRAVLDSSVVLASFMTVNNETGALYDVAEAFSIIKRFNPEIITHTDAVQAFGKVPISAQKLKADMITVSAHKIHGPMGVGALYVSKESLVRRRLVPTVFGGGQQSGFRSGTENYPGIAGFGAACDRLKTELLSDALAMAALRNYAVDKLASLNVKLNLPSVSAPHIISVTLPGIKSEVMLHFLSSCGIYVSSGSACSSNHPKTSRPLTAFGLSAFDADCTIRVSLSHLNEKTDIDALCEALGKGIDTLVRRKK